MADSVTYLGHRIYANGLHPVPKKLEAVQRPPKPCNVSELKAYLGLPTYSASSIILSPWDQDLYR